MNRFDAEELFEQHMHIAKETLYKTYRDPAGIARKNNIQVDDLLQYAYEGLYHACLNYDETKCKFTTHAINHVKWNINTRIKRECQIMKLHCNEKYDWDNMYKFVSMDKKLPDFDNEVTLHDVCSSETDIENEVMELLNAYELVNILGDQEREILNYKLHSLSNRQIGAKIGKSRQYVQLIVNDIKEKFHQARFGESVPKKEKRGNEIYIEGNVYETAKEAAEKLNIKLATVYSRIKSNNFHDWYFANTNREVV